MSDMLVDPREVFLATDPYAQPVAPKDSEPVDHNEQAIAVAIAAAVVVIVMLMRNHLKENPPAPGQDAAEHARGAWTKYLPTWVKLVGPLVMQAYKLGATATVSDEELRVVAEAYAANLGDYLQDTSAQAMADGVAAQLNSGWSFPLAWHRASAAYGLDKAQMKTTISRLLRLDPQTYVGDVIPPAMRTMVDRYTLLRADKLGMNETFAMTQVGRNIVWILQQADGVISADAVKQWNTAEDERVCEVCGPLDGVQIPLTEHFEGGIMAPGVHPRCRCEMSLEYPSQDVEKSYGKDPYTRDSHGEFARVEGRAHARVQNAPDNPFTNAQTVAEPAVKQVADPWAKQVADPWAKQVSVGAVKQVDPWAKQIDPFARLQSFVQEKTQVVADPQTKDSTQGLAELHDSVYFYADPLLSSDHDFGVGDILNFGPTWTPGRGVDQRNIREVRNDQFGLVARLNSGNNDMAFNGYINGRNDQYAFLAAVHNAVEDKDVEVGAENQAGQSDTGLQHAMRKNREYIAMEETYERLQLMAPVELWGILEDAGVDGDVHAEDPSLWDGTQDMNNSAQYEDLVEVVQGYVQTNMEARSSYFKTQNIDDANSWYIEDENFKAGIDATSDYDHTPTVFVVKPASLTDKGYGVLGNWTKPPSYLQSSGTGTFNILAGNYRVDDITMRELSDSEREETSIEGATPFRFVKVVTLVRTPGM